MAGKHAWLQCADARAARITARLAAGIVKPTSGTLLICDFDPRIQPVQAKRSAGYVPWNGDFGRLPGIADNRQRAIDLHAKLFDVPQEIAERRVASRLSEIGCDDEVAFAAALALMRPLTLLVLDRPPLPLQETLVRLLAGSVAVLSTAVRVEVRSNEVLSAR